MTKPALIIVDEQYDFMEGGALAVTGGRKVGQDTASYLADNHDRYELVFASQDWHLGLDRDPTGNCGHFAVPPASPDFMVNWPEHCVQGTPGADVYDLLMGELLRLGPRFNLIRKGQGVPAYSAFDGSVVAGEPSSTRFTGATLNSVLAARQITQLHVVGLAYDYCVYETVYAAATAGYSVTVFTSLTAAVNPRRAKDTDALLDALLDADYLITVQESP